jgi:hypothetical protein
VAALIEPTWAALRPIAADLPAPSIAPHKAPVRPFYSVIACGFLLGLFTTPTSASAQRVLTLEMVPTERAQIAVWIADAEGNFLTTIALTQSVARRGIGNRPGASMMNSGYRWPYGRREGVLPIWAHARASAPGAERFRRVIFQDRISEGHASRSSDDSTRDDYYCLTFNAMDSTRDRLDAVSCASVFSSDKGRYVTEEDVAGEYFEPQELDGEGVAYFLDLESLYPPRRDVVRCGSDGCVDHPDVARFLSDAERVMPELDAVTMATPRGDEPLALLFSVPDDWENGLYQVLVEVNTEGDWNESWGPSTYPTPSNDPAAPLLWDYWAENFGYPFRGQPSMLYRVEVEVTDGVASASTAMPAGYGSLSGQGPDGGEVTPLDDSMTNDPRGTPGSGVDRLHADGDGARVRVSSIGASACEDNAAPDAPSNLTVSGWTGDYRDAHRFAHLSFSASGDDLGIEGYEVRVSTVPIVDVPSFLRGVPANGATLESEGLQVPSSALAGTEVEVDMGGLIHETHYWVGMRAIDRCNVASAVSVAEYTTPEITFTTVSPCFVATATYGDPMASEIGSLRRFRDRYLESNAVGHALVETYYAVGPTLARFIEGDEDRRAIARGLLAAPIALARWLE